VTPEYIHVVLNHLPLFGLLIGAALLLASLIRKSGELRGAALVVIAVTGLSAWPVSEFGERGYDRVYSMSNLEGQVWLKTHSNRADKAVPVVYVTVALAVAALVATRKKPAFAHPLSIATLLAAALSFVLLGWVARAGGQIRHPEFRPPHAKADERP
jgi:cytochrome b